MAATSKTAQTALGPMIVAAAEQYLPAKERIVDDAKAASLLSGAGKMYAGLCRFKPLSAALYAISEAKGPGVWGSILARKRFIDDVAAKAVAEGIGAIVILGAGFDTRGIRFALPAGVPSFEIDLPENIADKRTALERAGGVPAGLTLLPVDFETVDLGKVLTDAGYDAAAPTLFVWEGVTQYLSEPAVRKTMDFLAKAAPGSRLVFTYVLKDFIAGSAMHGARRIYRNMVEGARIWHFGMAPDEIDSFIAPYGWREVEDVGAADHRRRYFTPTGRDLNILEIERIVVADKIG